MHTHIHMKYVISKYFFVQFIQFIKYYNIVQYFAPYDYMSLKKIVFDAFSYNSKMINNIYFMYKL